MRIASGSMAVLFGGMAALQWNDPDPALWILVYAAGAVCSGLYATGVRITALAWGLAVLCGLGLGILGVQILFGPGILDPTGQEMMGVTEPTREFLGVAVVGGWTALLARWDQQSMRASSDQ